jgi:uncharacterized protein DUF3352
VPNVLRRVLALSVCLALVVSGCVATTPGPATFRSADLFPANTWFYSSVATRVPVSEAAALMAVQSAFTSQPGWNTAVQSITSEAAGTRAGISELQGLLSGEVAIGVSGLPSGEPRAVAALESSNAERFLSLFATSPRSTFTHNGVQVVQLGADVFGAASKGWVILSADRSSIEGVLDRLAGPPGQNGLSAQARFRAAVGRLPQDKFGLTYTDVAQVFSDPLLRRTAGESLPPDVDLRQLPSSAAAYTFVPDGLEIRIEASAPYPGSDVLAGFSPPQDALAGFGRLPASTLLAVSGAAPPESVQMAAELAQLGLEQVRESMPELAELDLHPESWLTGQFAFGLGSGSLRPGFLQLAGTPAVFGVLGVSDPGAAARDLMQLERLLPPKSVDLVDVAGQSLEQVSLGEGQDQVVTYGVSDGWLYAIGGGGDPAEVISAADEGGLAEGNARFGMVRRVLRDEGVNLFIDLDASRTLLEQQAGLSTQPQYQRMVRLFVAPVHAFGAAYWFDDTGLTHAQLLVAISRP